MNHLHRTGNASARLERTQRTNVGPQTPNDTDVISKMLELLAAEMANTLRDRERRIHERADLLLASEVSSASKQTRQVDC